VPYYRELFASIGLEPGDITSLDEFATIPVLTKDILRAHRDDLVSTAYQRDALLIHNSGGSTGVPVSFFRDRSYLDASDAGTYRNLSQCGWQPGDMVAFVWGFNTRLDAMRPIEFELRQRIRRFYQFDPFKSSPADLDAWVDRMRTIQPTAVQGHASTIARLARRMLETGRTIPGVRGVFTTAERLYAPQRKDMQEAFGCTVYDLYGSSEVQNIAAECLSQHAHQRRLLPSRVRYRRPGFRKPAVARHVAQVARVPVHPLSQRRCGYRRRWQCVRLWLRLPCDEADGRQGVGQLHPAQWTRRSR